MIFQKVISNALLLGGFVFCQSRHQHESLCGEYYSYKPSILKAVYYRYVKDIEIYTRKDNNIVLKLNCDSTFEYYLCDTIRGKWRTENMRVVLYKRKNNDSLYYFWGFYFDDNILFYNGFIYKQYPHKKQKIKVYLIKKG